MPDAAGRAHAELRLTRVEGTWREPLPSGAALLRFTDDAIEIAWTGRAVRVEYGAITGAHWRGDTLTIHALGGSVRLQSETGMERAWTSLLRLACPIPEFTRGLRALGSRRSGAADAQGRFFAPMLQARRRLAEEGDLDSRLSSFRAPELGERLARALTELAASVHPRSGPDRRSLEAELRDEAFGLFAALQALDRAAGDYERAAEQARFSSWRTWVGTVSQVFAAADRAWEGIARTLPPERSPGRRRRRWRGTGAILLVTWPGILAEVLRP